MAKTPTPLGKEFTKGLWAQNPILKQVLGMCPTLAVTNSAVNAFAMGLATSFVLLMSSTLVGLVRKMVPSQVRIAVYVVIIAGFVTIADYFLRAQFPDISRALGPFVPLIVVNCVILGRQEAFTSRNPVGRSIVDAAGMGVGFTLALIVMGSVRELLGNGSVFGVTLLPQVFERWTIMLLPPGAFLALGVLIGTSNLIAARRQRRAPAAQ
ncbi:electron transport complex subunit RsxE [Candidatus Fermentibacteria bacterium]|nr:electron transport complex subunit RsxE [Candidatus Fermentibacteria bacterium]